MSRAEIVALIREYALLNMSECTAATVGDPVLRGGRMDADFAMSETMQIHSTIHSAKYHAAKDILVLIGEDVSDL